MHSRHRRVLLRGRPSPAFIVDFIRQQSPSGLTFSRSSSKYYWGADGFLNSVGNNAIAYSFDPIGVDPSITSEPEHQARGVLIEEQIRNLALHSSSFNNAVWVQTGTPSISQSGTVFAPDGVTLSPYIGSADSGASEGIDQTMRTRSVDSVRSRQKIKNVY